MEELENKVEKISQKEDIRKKMRQSCTSPRHPYQNNEEKEKTEKKEGKTEKKKGNHK